MQQLHFHTVAVFSMEAKFAAITVQIGRKDATQPYYWQENYTFHSTPMGLAAGKADVSMHLMNYTERDLAAIFATIQEWCELPRMDHGIITFLWFGFINEWIQRDL